MARTKIDGRSDPFARCGKLGPYVLSFIAKILSSSHHWILLNPFHYVLSLRLRHPTVDLSDATSRLELEPTRVWRSGVPRTDINGAALPGVYPESYWTAPLLNAEKLLSTDVSLDESLGEVVRHLNPHRQFLMSLRNSGGACACSVGVFASANFGVEIPAALMRGLVDLGIDLEVDAYP